MEILPNKWRGDGIQMDEIPMPSDDATAPMALLKRCPDYRETPLCDCTTLAQRHGLGAIYIKDERTRMGLGSFKALGAAYVIAHMAATGDISDHVFVTASAGNHGLSVAAGAGIFGAKSVVYISNAVPESFAKRLSDLGAQVVRAGDTYQASMDAAQDAAQKNNWFLLSDSSWNGYVDAPHRLMQGYTVLAQETVAQIPAPPTHIFLQAGVGGLAGAIARYARRIWGDDPTIIVVEPDRAPALINSIRAGKCVLTQGAESNMGRLDCKEPSLIALKGLSLDADYFMTITDDECVNAIADLPAHDLETSPSGGAGYAGLTQLIGQYGLDETARVLCILSEGSDI
ncbi:PLP-dependent lyase/thiolase [Amylibacter kogurei]|uniref:PLP-dependent lyase/thiolase n=1 Tax=Paramylibacter kogurei TaxID=1889778 RepID=A0A2G5K5G4_9RHOB|nr:pyridoxal-phosphate dependent enzyme [Amylibacter kogurei]PIB24263.1 PLP-dependent lyase/thiolase [Amylibacter kogurei]